MHMTYTYHMYCTSISVRWSQRRLHLSARPFIHMNSNQTVKKENLENNANVGAFSESLFLKYTYFSKI